MSRITDDATSTQDAPAPPCAQPEIVQLDTLDAVCAQQRVSKVILVCMYKYICIRVYVYIYMYRYKYMCTYT